MRPARGVTQFPAGITTAATWDRDLMYARGKAMGQEFYDQGIVSPRMPWEANAPWSESDAVFLPRCHRMLLSRLWQEVRLVVPS